MDSTPRQLPRPFALMLLIGLVVQGLDGVGLYEPRGGLGLALLIVGGTGFFATAAFGIVELIRADREESR